MNATEPAAPIVKPCKRGHAGIRYASGGCIECGREADRLRAPEVRARRRTPEQKKKDRAWRQTPEHRAKRRERERLRAQRPKVREAQRARQKTPEYLAKQRDRQRRRALRLSLLPVTRGEFMQEKKRRLYWERSVRARLARIELAMVVA